jgi:hypothetical protein
MVVGQKKIRYIAENGRFIAHFSKLNPALLIK